MCNCENIEVGSYDNQVELIPPKHMADYKALYQPGTAPTICVDTCIADEVLDLWAKGITTTGCCCGHNKVQPYIGVVSEDSIKMTGYEEIKPDHFKPKSI